MDRLSRRFPRYSRLLYLYPAEYRRHYGEQMLQTLADMLDDSEHTKASVWIRLTLDFPVSVVKQQITYTGESMATDTPTYVKRAALSGAWLVAPFFVFIVLNSLLHSRLQHSWVWHTDALFTWLIILPSLAAIFNLMALLRWVQGRRKLPRMSAWKALTDFRRTWPLLLMILVGVGILGIVFFHDSVHCVSGNPIRELHNPHQTWRCIQRG